MSPSRYQRSPVSFLKVKLEKWLLLTALFALILMVAAPFIFTMEAITSRFNFTNTGEIGDTIGGLTAPFTGLIAAILIYLSFLAQRDANKIVVRQASIDRVYDSLATELDLHIPNSISHFRISREKKWINGRDGLMKLASIYDKGDTYLNQYFGRSASSIKFFALVKRMKTVAALIENSEFSMREKAFLIGKYKFMLNTELEMVKTMTMYKKRVSDDATYSDQAKQVKHDIDKILSMRKSIDDIDFANVIDFE